MAKSRSIWRWVCRPSHSESPVSREYLGDAGIYAAFGSADDLAAKIRLALDQRTWAASLGALGRDRAVRELSWEHAARQIEAIYAEALGRRVRRPTTDVGARYIVPPHIVPPRPTTDEAPPLAIARRPGEEREEVIERGAMRLPIITIVASPTCLLYRDGTPAPIAIGSPHAIRRLAPRPRNIINCSIMHSMLCDFVVTL